MGRYDFEEVEHNGEARGRMLKSATYVVIVNEMPEKGGWPPMTWLSIRHVNRARILTWREMQCIKNAICGPEREGFEIYPSESRLVDTCNQYHLWVLPEGLNIPVGFREREVMTATEMSRLDAAQGTNLGPRQRPFNAATEAASRSTEEVLEADRQMRELYAQREAAQ